MFARNMAGCRGLILVLLLLGVGCDRAAPAATYTPEPPPTATPEWTRPGWQLVWHDEFGGETVDRNNWTFDIGGSGWGNNEWEFYTDRPENVRLEDGYLIIEAREEHFIRRDYTSARLKTEGLHEWTYGRVEARLKLPAGQGIWPAFWMLGAIPERWPRNGEIDIMENIGREPNTVHGTVHGPGYSGAAGVGGRYVYANAPFATDFHHFAVEWEPDVIRWYVDDRHYHTVTSDDVPGEWVFDHPFFIILNVAVGGNWPGYPDETTAFPQRMLVDYVRVYQREAGDD